MRSNSPDGGFRLIALDDRNDFRPILIPTGFDDSRFFLKGIFILHILIILNGYNIGFLNEYLIT